MAQIRERVKKNGKKTFLVRIRMKGKTEATASFERLTDARLWAQHTETAIREGRYATTVEAQKHTVSDLVERYIRDVLPRKPKIQREYALQLKWWEDQIGDVLLSDLSSSLISEQRDLLSEKVTNRKRIISNARVNRYMATLSTTITTAVKEWEWMEDNPLRKVSKLKEPRGRVRYLERIGFYNPMVSENRFGIDEERVKHWLSVGAQPTERVSKLMKQAKIKV